MSKKALSNLPNGGSVAAGDIGYVVRGGNSRRVDLGDALAAKQPLDADLTAIAALANADGNFIVGDGATWVAESGNTARTSLGLGTGDSPTFASITVATVIGGAAADSLLTLKSTSGVGTTDAIVFEVGNNGATEAARFDTSGRFIKGHNSGVESGTSFTPEFQLHRTSGNQNNASFFRWTNDAASPQHFFGKSRGAVPGTHTIVQSGDGIGILRFDASDGTKFVQGAVITAEVDGSPGVNDMPTRLVIHLTADGASTPTERFRIANGGNVYFPGASTTASAANAFLNSGSTPANELLRSTSSARYKRDIEDLQDEYADALLLLRPVWYRSTSKADRPDWSWYGLIAEEVAQVDPRLVHWGFAEEDWESVEVGDGDDKRIEHRLKDGVQLKPDGVTYDRLTVLLLSIVQRQQTAIADLQKQVAALAAP